jgi:hypothetical protein
LQLSDSNYGTFGNKKESRDGEDFDIHQISLLRKYKSCVKIRWTKASDIADMADHGNGAVQAESKRTFGARRAA